MNTVSIRESQADFFERVYAVVRLIPAGRATSYGAIAKYLGAGRSSRIVGYAMNGADRQPGLPAHRVVNRNGMLSGKHHFSPPETMQKRLEEEGVKVNDDKIQDWKTVFWDPETELSID